MILQKAACPGPGAAAQSLAGLSEADVVRDCAQVANGGECAVPLLKSHHTLSARLFGPGERNRSSPIFSLAAVSRVSGRFTFRPAASLSWNDTLVSSGSVGSPAEEILAQTSTKFDA